MLIKYINSVLWSGAKRVSYTEDARCLKVNTLNAATTKITPSACSVLAYQSNGRTYYPHILPSSCRQQVPPKLLLLSTKL